MVTSSDEVTYPNSASRYVDNGDGTRGFTSKWACVTRPGWGFNGRWSFPCEKGSFNSGDNWYDCTPCPGIGQTTAAAGAGVKVSDCGTAPGYGFQAGAIAACPIGECADRCVVTVHAALRLALSAAGHAACVRCSHAGGMLTHARTVQHALQARTTTGALTTPSPSPASAARPAPQPLPQVLRAPATAPVSALLWAGCSKGLPLWTPSMLLSWPVFSLPRPA